MEGEGSPKMNLTEMSGDTATPALSEEERLRRLEGMIAQLTTIVMNNVAANSSSLQDSYGMSGVFLESRNPLHTLATEEEERERRRKSIIVNQIKDKQASSTVSSLTTVAMPIRFESKALMNNVNFLQLKEFQDDYALWTTNPGSENQLTLLWNNKYMSQLTRDRTYRRLEAFDNVYQTDKLFQARYPKWTLPSESSLSTAGLIEVLSYLEIAIVPDNPREYEKALQDICKSVIDLGKTSVSPSACSYYLGKVKRVVDLIRKYTELVPESVKVGTKDEKTRYNMGTRKDATHGTKGTMVIVSEAIMTPELRFAFADFANPPTHIPTLSGYLQYLEDSSDQLQKIYDRLRGWLLACQTHEQKRKVGSETKIADRHKSNRLEFAEPPAETDGKSAQADNSENDDDDTTLDIHDSAAIEASELKKTPCYAYIEGKCEAGKNCARSHDKKVLQTFLNERSAMVNKMP